MSDSIYTLHVGNTPLLVSLPHVGTDIPDYIRSRFVDRALHTEDTDWHLTRLYEFVRALGASVIAPRYSRYVIDLNRPPDNTPMYAGASNTDLCPTSFFTGEPLYREGMAPDAAEVRRRREHYWQPYHHALRLQLDRQRAEFGYAMLWDGHSIRSEIPWLFDGKLPDLNLGTVNAESCALSVRLLLSKTLSAHAEFTHAVDGRFKGGYIARHYGKPSERIHAVQMEMCQSLYMQETAPFAYNEFKAEIVTPVLREMIEQMLAWRPDEE